MIKPVVHALGRWYIRKVLLSRFVHQREPRVHENAPAYRFALEQLMQAGAQRVLDVGSGTTAWPSLLADCGFHVTATDEMGAYWDNGFFNHHFHVLQADITNTGITGQFHAVTLMSALQHVPDPAAAVASMAELLAPGGLLVLAFPYAEAQYVEDVYRLPGAGYGQDLPYRCHVFSR